MVAHAEARDGAETILRYSVTTRSRKECVEQIAAWLNDTNRSRWLACLNPHSCVVAESDVLFQNALQTADILVPDGIGVVLASRLCGGRIKHRITGSDIFLSVNELLNRGGGRSVFFLGSTEENLEAIRHRMQKDYPAVRIAGTFAPPFKTQFTDEDIAEMIARINSVRPDVLWVGMTAPKQEIWLSQNLSLLDVRFAAAIGAVFDFYTGRIKRSPAIFRTLGLEWLPRLLQEPRRLWRRSLQSFPVFVWRVLKSRR